MPAVNPVRLLVKLPVPLPLVVWLLLIVGVDEVLQHTPRAVTVNPPSLVILPPLVAEVAAMLLAAVVVSVGIPFKVVKLFCAP